MVRNERASSNGISSDFETISSADIEAVFDELERWNDILKDDKTILRGPKP